MICPYFYKHKSMRRTCSVCYGKVFITEKQWRKFENFLRTGRGEANGR